MVTGVVAVILLSTGSILWPNKNDHLFLRQQDDKARHSQVEIGALHGLQGPMLTNRFFPLPPIKGHLCTCYLALIHPVVNVKNFFFKEMEPITEAAKFGLFKAIVFT